MTIEFRKFELVEVPTLLMQRQFSFFRPNLLQKEEYLNITMELSIFELVYRPILIIKKQF